MFTLSTLLDAGSRAGRFGSKRAFVTAALLLWSIACVAAPPKSCMPQAIGVPGLSGPPDWINPPWNGRAGGNGQDWINDPRWRGSLARGYGAGGPLDVNFRAVATGSAGKSSYSYKLYVSWNVRVVPGESADHHVYLGLYQETAGGAPETSKGGYVIDVHLPTTTATTCGASCPTDPATGLAFAPPQAPGATNFTVALYKQGASPGAAWQLDTSEAWFTNFSKAVAVSKYNADAFTWNVAMVVPVESDVTKGLPILNWVDNPNAGGPTNFLMWYDVQTFVAAVSPDLATWPRPVAPATNAAYAWSSIADPNYPRPPDPTGASTPWGEVQLSSCTATGVSLSVWNQIGTNNPSESQNTIDPWGKNTFFAKPTNTFGSDIPANGLLTTFRLADWGSVADSNAPWFIIPRSPIDAGGAPQNLSLFEVPNVSKITASSPIDVEPPLTAVNGTVMDMSNGMLVKTPVTAAGQPRDAWNLHCAIVGRTNTYDIAHGINPPISPDPSCDATAYATPVLPLHQCMEVSMSGAGIDFVSDSVATNMNFAKASSFERDAQINIQGLASLGGAARDVYVFLEKRNMPTFPTFGVGSPPPTPRQPPPDTGGGQGDGAGGGAAGGPPGAVGVPAAATSTAAASGPVNPKYDPDALQKMPTYIVHVYHDTGQKRTVNGTTYAVVEPQSSFGYFVQHEGVFFGWDAGIAASTPGLQVTKVGKDFYKLSVPEGGRVIIKTQVNTVDLTTWWIWLLVILIVLIIVLILKKLKRAGP
jgi:hypothetical protein